MDGKLREEIAQLHAQFCGALADKSRVLLLYAVAEKQRNVNDLAGYVDLPQPTVSRHLKVLRDRGLLVAEREGQCVYYRLSDPRIIDALNTLRVVMTEQIQSQFILARDVENMGY